MQALQLGIVLQFRGGIHRVLVDKRNPGIFVLQLQVRLAHNG